MPILSIENLSKTIKGNYIVKNINLQIKSGEIVGLLGPNGAGKTTTFYMIVGIIPNDSGRIMIDTDDISILPLHIRARRGLGYLPQESSIFRQLNVFDNLMAILQIYNNCTKKQQIAQASTLMDTFKISHLRNRLGCSLSGGERRRVEIARALIINPKFILLDEPFAGVDPISIFEIKQTIKYLSSNGLGVFITDHNVRETLDVCDRSYILHQGHLIAHGSPEDILLNKTVKQVYLGQGFYI